MGRQTRYRYSRPHRRSLSFYDSYVGLRIRPHQLSGKLASIGDVDLERGGLIDDVVIRQDIARGAHDYAGSEALFALVTRPPATLPAEKLAEERVRSKG